MTQPASWSVLNEADPYSRARREHVRAERTYWRTLHPLEPIDSEEDWTAVCTRIHRSTGLSKSVLSSSFSALDTLDQLPRLKTLVEATDLLDLYLLKIIDQAIACAPTDIRRDPYFWEALDEDLIRRFTPSRPQQLLPGKRAISDTVKGTIRSVEELAARQGEPDPWGHPEPEPDEPAPQPCDDPAALLKSLPPTEDDQETTPSLHAEHEPDGTMSFHLNVDQATGTLLLDAVSQAGADENISRARALVKLVLGQTTTDVTSLIYSAHDVADSPVYHPLTGLLTTPAASTLLGMATRSVDMDQAGASQSTAYQAPFGIRAHLVGRDWVCRWPGCSRTAVQCDADHRINHADGGPTTATNMVMLCRHHHNRKTDQQATYLLDPVTGDVYWHFPDGTYTVDLATGPLAPREKRWVQTYAQRRERSREHAAAQAAAERLAEYQRRHAEPEEPDPPDEEN